MLELSSCLGFRIGVRCLRKVALRSKGRGLEGKGSIACSSSSLMSSSEISKSAEKKPGLCVRSAGNDDRSIDHGRRRDCGTALVCVSLSTYLGRFTIRVGALTGDVETEYLLGPDDVADVADGCASDVQVEVDAVAVPEGTRLRAASGEAARLRLLFLGRSASIIAAL